MLIIDMDIKMEGDFQILRQRIRKTYKQTIKEKLSRRIVLIENNQVFPTKNNILENIVSKIENVLLKSVLREDYPLYLRSIKGLDMKTIKNLSLGYKVDLARLHGYKKYVCDTEDEYISSVIDKVYKMY